MVIKGIWCEVEVILRFIPMVLEVSGLLLEDTLNSGLCHRWFDCIWVWAPCDGLPARVALCNVKVYTPLWS